MSKVLNITGNRYGELTALRPLTSSEGKRYWLLSCTCGREAIKTVLALHGLLRCGSLIACEFCTKQARPAVKPRRYNPPSVTMGNYRGIREKFTHEQMQSYRGYLGKRRGRYNEMEAVYLVTLDPAPGECCRSCAEKRRAA
jgi:hypothetical protein